MYQKFILYQKQTGGLNCDTSLKILNVHQFTCQSTKRNNIQGVLLTSSFLNQLTKEHSGFSYKFTVEVDGSVQQECEVSNVPVKSLIICYCILYSNLYIYFDKIKKLH